MKIKILFLTLLLSLVSTVQAKTYQFPETFQWCVATAGHQIEGDNIYSDWWAFEKQPGRIDHGAVSGKASYHMERLEEDIGLMKDLNVDTYRFSIEWSRIEPEQGKINPEAIAHYKREIALLKERGIKPMITIHHFVQPQWFTESGGWERADSPEIFMNYVEVIQKHFGSEAEYWVTFNEPMVLLIAGYGDGFFPPGKSDWNLWKPMLNILRSHALAYTFLHHRAKTEGYEIKVGMAHHIRPLIGKGFLAEKLSFIPDYLLNWNIPTALTTGKLFGVDWKNILGVRIPWPQYVNLPELAGTQDFYGLNYYTREVVSASFTPPFYLRETLPDVPVSELDWSIDPEGFFVAIKESHKIDPQLPIFITENGLADEKDQWRGFYIASHLHQLHRAMTELSIDVKGYCHWSLLDNFEWAEGFWPRFGLYEVDYKNKGERRARPSVEMVRELFETNTLHFPIDEGS